MAQNEVLSMMTFTWNTNKIPFCGTMSNSRDCAPIDFWNNIEGKIVINNPILISIAIQDAISLDLKLQMSRLRYTLIRMETLGSCTLYIYSRVPNIFINEVINAPGFGTTIILLLPNRQRWGIVNMCITEPSQANLSKAFIDLVYTPPMEYVLIMGSYGFKPNSCPLPALLRPNNKCEDRGILFKDGDLLEEGVYNQGPTFPPTCYLSTDRRKYVDDTLMRPINDDGEYIPKRHHVSVHDFEHNHGAWCDRIFYGTFQRAFNVRLVCTEYERIDEPTTNMRMSKHAIVYGYYTFERIEQPNL